MFSVHCSQHGRDVLLSHRSYEVHNTDDGIVVHWRCPCGANGWTRTGRRRRRSRRLAD